MKQLFTPPFIFYTVISITMLILILAGNGYTIATNYGSVFKANPNKKADNLLAKIRSQYSSNKDMKTAMLFELMQLYEKTLRVYIKEKGRITTENEIQKNLKYYRLVVIAINDACEEKTVENFIFANHLFRYRNKDEWEHRKQRAAATFNNEGKKVLSEHYNNAVMIMPLREWVSRVPEELASILGDNTNSLLDDLKKESELFKDQND